jgi:hypothetical protein
MTRRIAPSKIYRKCRVCGTEAHNEKELDLFRNDKRMFWGKANLCWKCLSENSVKMHLQNKEKINKCHSERRKQKPGYWKFWKATKATKENKARALANKIPITVSCKLCGSTQNLVRHHPDYNKPLDFIVLCKGCHAKVHSKYQIPLLEIKN